MHPYHYQFPPHILPPNSPPKPNSLLSRSYSHSTHITLPSHPPPLTPFQYILTRPAHSPLAPLSFRSDSTFTRCSLLYFVDFFLLSSHLPSHSSHCLSLPPPPSTALVLPSHCLSLPFYCPRTALSLPLTPLLLPSYCPLTASRFPSTALSLPLTPPPLLPSHCSLTPTPPYCPRTVHSLPSHPHPPLLPSYCPLTALSPPPPPFTALVLPTHCPLTPLLLPSHCQLTALSLLFYCPRTAHSLAFHSRTPPLSHLSEYPLNSLLIAFHSLIRLPFSISRPLSDHEPLQWHLEYYNR